MQSTSHLLQPRRPPDRLNARPNFEVFLLELAPSVPVAWKLIWNRLPDDLIATRPLAPLPFSRIAEQAPFCGKLKQTGRRKPTFPHRDPVLLYDAYSSMFNSRLRLVATLGNLTSHRG